MASFTYRLAPGDILRKCGGAGECDPPKNIPVPPALSQTPFSFLPLITNQQQT